MAPAPREGEMKELSGLGRIEGPPGPVGAGRSGVVLGAPFRIRVPPPKLLVTGVDSLPSCASSWPAVGARGTSSLLRGWGFVRNTSAPAGIL